MTIAVVSLCSWKLLVFRLSVGVRPRFIQTCPALVERPVRSGRRLTKMRIPNGWVFDLARAYLCPFHMYASIKKDGHGRYSVGFIPSVLWFEVGNASLERQIDLQLWTVQILSFHIGVGIFPRKWRYPCYVWDHFFICNLKLLSCQIAFYSPRREGCTPPFHRETLYTTIF